MRYGKSNIIALLGITVLLALIAFFALQSEKKYESSSEKVFGFDSADVKLINIKSPEGDISLEKENDIWYVVNPVRYEANQNSVERIVSASERLKIGTPISENPEKFSKFDLDDSSSIKVRLNDGKKDYEFLIGKLSSDFSHSYVRLKDEDKVYLAEGRLTYDFKKSTDNWRDKVILNLEPDQISELKFIYPDKEFTAVKGDTSWTVKSAAKDIQAPDKKITPILNRLKNFRTFTFVDTLKEDMDFSKPDFRMEIKTGNDSYGFNILNDPDEDRYKYLQLDTKKDMAFKIYGSHAESFLKKIEDFEE